MNRVKRYRNLITNRRWAHTHFFIPAIYCLFATSVLAQLAPPPALGPPSYRSDKIQLGVGVLSGFVKTQVAQIVTQANDAIHRQTSTISVEALPLRVFSPMRVATQFTNRPNEYYVQLPMEIAIKVKLPVTSDRTIYIGLALNLSCEGWQNGTGKIQILAKTDPPVIEGGNIVEDVIRVRDIIDGLIKSQITLPGAINFSLPNAACITIGASPSQSVGDPFAFISYDSPSKLGQIRNLSALPKATVTFDGLKRLRARGQGGSVLYQETENIMLETYANFVTRQSDVLTMKEGDETALKFEPSIVEMSGRELLVVIANIRSMPTGQPEDSAFAAAARAANFSPGTHTLQINKVYTEPPGPGHTKPLQIRVPAYELTYTVHYSNSGLLRAR